MLVKRRIVNNTYQWDFKNIQSCLLKYAELIIIFITLTTTLTLNVNYGVMEFSFNANMYFSLTYLVILNYSTLRTRAASLYTVANQLMQLTFQSFASQSTWNIMYDLLEYKIRKVSWVAQTCILLGKIAVLSNEVSFIVILTPWLIVSMLINTCMHVHFSS